MLEAKVIAPFRCKLTKRNYSPGDVYRHPNEERMQYLASLEPPRVEWPPKGNESGETTLEAEPRHVGGGWYELPDGGRVRGKDAALAALRGE